jgi:hypothetical protein
MFILFWLKNALIDPRTRANEIEKAAHYSSISAFGPRVLVIRGVDDEASLTLAAGSIGSRLSSLALHLIAISVSLVIFVGALAGWVYGREWDGLLILIIDACALSALAFLFLPGLFKSAFGRELLTMGFLCDIASDSTPDTTSGIDSITLPPAATKKEGISLHHSIYEHSNCVQKIVDWLEASF